MECGVVIVAAGRGLRLQQSQHKALVTLEGRPLFFFCLESFSESSAVDEVVIVVHRDDLPTFQSGAIAEELQRLGITKIVVGGAERQDSVLMGLRALDPSTKKALVHDAARPFCSQGTIRKLVSALDNHAAAVPVVQVTSTVKEVDQDNVVVGTQPRASLRLAQTPQGAQKDLLIQALEQAQEAGASVTDDVQAMEEAGYSVVCVDDSRWNFKVTSPDDLLLASLVIREGLNKEDA